MRIMLTVVSEHGHRDVVVDGDEETTVAGLAIALKGAPGESRGNVVRLSRARAPYGMGGRARPREPEAPSVWVDGRRLDPGAPIAAALRDGDLVTLDKRAAGSTVVAEPGGVVEVRVTGGPSAGSVHRLGLGVHVIGSDPACAVPLGDHRLPADAAEVRVTRDEVLVRSVLPPGRPPAKPSWRARRKARRLARRGGSLTPAHGAAAGKTEVIGALDRGEPHSATVRLGGEPVGMPRKWPEGTPLTCGNTVLVVRATEPPDAHLDALPEGGLAYNRPPRLRPAERRRRFEVPAEPTRGEGVRLQLLAACLPAVLGITMAAVFHIWFYLLIALMTPMIMIGQWVSDRRHGRRKYRQDVKAYKERLAAFDAAVEKARAVNEVERRAASPDPAELLLTATGPRRRLWERGSHDPDALRLRIGLADLPAEIEFVPERGASPDARMPDPPTCGAVPVSLAMRRLGVAGMTGPRDVTTRPRLVPGRRRGHPAQPPRPGRRGALRRCDGADRGDGRAGCRTARPGRRGLRRTDRRRPRGRRAAGLRTGGADRRTARRRRPARPRLGLLGQGMGPVVRSPTRNHCSPRTTTARTTCWSSSTAHRCCAPSPACRRCCGRARAPACTRSRSTRTSGCFPRSARPSSTAGPKASCGCAAGASTPSARSSPTRSRPPGASGWPARSPRCAT